jgi:4-hydroxy-3-polyprenylbenzoate decarboxylase
LFGLKLLSKLLKVLDGFVHKFINQDNRIASRRVPGRAISGAARNWKLCRKIRFAYTRIFLHVFKKDEGFMRIIVGITGASGALYGLRLLKELAKLGHEVHATVSEYGWKVLDHECGVGEETIRPLVHALYSVDDIIAPIASGSFRADVMVVVPCSMKTLGTVASGIAGNLLCRAADVMLKERKNLVLAVRETPLSAIHLENMLKLARLGVGIVPASPGFYHNPETIDDLAAIMAGRIMDSMGIESNLFKRWNGIPAE